MSCQTFLSPLKLSVCLLEAEGSATEEPALFKLKLSLCLWGRTGEVKLRRQPYMFLKEGKT